MVDPHRFHRTRDWAALMKPWPQSWAGIAADIPIGEQLVQLFMPFVVHLQKQQLTPKTIRRHVDHLWCIGGEIIRDLHLDFTLRHRSAVWLLYKAIIDGHAPLVRDASESEQQALDATARKLAKFLATQK